MTNLTPIVNAPNLYVNGLGLNIPSPNNLSVNIIQGACRDSTNVNDIVSNSSINISVTANGINGLDTGTLTTNTVYAVHIIGDSSNYHPAAALISLSPLFPTMPVGYDMYRRIGWITTETVSSVIQPKTMWQSGTGTSRTYYYNNPISVLSGGTATTFTNVSLANAVGLSTPNGAPNQEVYCNLTYTSASAANTVDFGLLFGGSNPIVSRSNGAASTVITPIWLNMRASGGTPFIAYRTTSASDSVTLTVCGFRDSL